MAQARRGPLEPEKRGPIVRGARQPDASETESAQLLANDALDELSSDGLAEGEVRALADRFIAEDRGTTVEEFVAWVRAEA